MHIAEGILPASVLVGGAVVAAAGTYLGLRRLDPERVPQVGLAAAFLFVASLIPVPLPGTSVHLVLNGLAGLLLGWAVFPAFLVVLFLQAVLFSFGGLTTLGVNTANMALPGVVCCFLFRRAVRSDGRVGAAAAFAVGALSVLLAAAMTGLCLLTISKEFAAVGVLAHIPIMLIEGLICVFVAAYLRKVKPELLAGAAREER